MTTVYVVTSGDYENYHIDGVFSTRQQAEDFITPLNKICDWHPLLSNLDLIPDSKYHIKEYNLDTLSTDLTEEDTVNKAYNYYQEYLKRVGKYDAGFWKPVSK